MNNPYTLRIALTTCDDIFEVGGVSASITRIARDLSTHYNAQVDILMLNSNQQAEFNPAGSNGIIQFDQNLDNVSIYKITPWTGGTSEAQRWVDIHYALLEIARERQYDLMMDVFTFTSLHDGCPNTVLEAMLAGTPIVATRAGAVPELIENGKHGLLVQPGSATGLCEALLRMLATNTDRQQYGKQAQQRVLTAFAPQKELESYWKVYLECLSSK